MQSHRDRFVEGAIARGVDARGRRARLQPDPRLLGLRLPEVARGGVRPARLPVDLAAGPLRARVPLLAAQRAADGLLPARRARPRGAATRDRGAGRRTSTAASVLCRVERGGERRCGPGGPDRARLRQGADRATTRRPSSPSASAAAPIGTSASSPRARGPAATGSSGSPGRVPAASSDGCRGPATGAALAARRRPRRPAGGASSSPCRCRCPTRRRSPSRRPGSGSRPTTAPTASRSSEHPLTLLRGGLDPATVTCAALDADPATAAELVVAGLLVARQRPATAKGVMFLLIEDETGVANVIVVPPVYERHRLTVRTASLVTIAGRLERREGVVNVVASGRRADRAPRRPAGRGPHDRAVARHGRPAATSATSTPSSPSPTPSGRRGR